MSPSGEKCLIITNKTKKLLGTLSDGDLWKYLLKGNIVSYPIEDIFQKNPTILIQGLYELNDAKIWLEICRIFISKKKLTKWIKKYFGVTTV